MQDHHHLGESKFVIFSMHRMATQIFLILIGRTCHIGLGLVATETRSPVAKMHQKPFFLNAKLVATKITLNSLGKSLIIPEKPLLPLN